MICPNCSQNNDDNARFCTACGHTLQIPSATPPAEQTVPSMEEAVPSAEQVTPPEEQTTQPPQNTTSPAPTSIPYVPPYVVPQQQGEEPVSLLKWLGIMALEMLCGIAHFVLMIVWAVSSKTTKSLKNYARAKLIMTAVSLVLVIVLIVVMVFCTSAFWNIASEVLYPREDPSYFEDPYDFGEYFDGTDPYSYFEDDFYNDFSSWS